MFQHYFHMTLDDCFDVLVRSMCTGGVQYWLLCNTLVGSQFCRNLSHILFLLGKKAGTK